MVLLGFLIGVAKGGVGAVGALLTTLLSLIMPVSKAVGVLVPLFIVGDIFALWTYWRAWDGGLVWRTLPVGVLGAVAGTYLLASLPTNTLRVALAVFVLVIVGSKFLSDRIQRLRFQSRAWHGPAAGLASGVASGMFNNGGPPYSAYLLLQHLPARTFIGTAALFFAALNVVKVPSLLIARVLDLPLLLSVWWAVLFIPVGILAARRLLTRLNQQWFENVILVLLVVSSAVLIWQGLGQ